MELYYGIAYLIEKKNKYKKYDGLIIESDTLEI